ncbi:MAG: ABC transporter permease subunit [Phycisphaerae bacterium]|nr:ABC transporter permease subunit [Phycisphaerae bacterium]
MIQKLIVIARNTFTEAIRQPVYFVIIAFALFLFVMSPSVTMYTLDEDIKLLREIGLSTLFLSGLFIAIFSATGAVTEEIETRTITTVLSKPIGRPTFLVGKFLGITAAVALAHYICTIALLMIIRHGVLESVSDTHDWPVIVTALVVLTVTLLVTAFLNYTYDWPFGATGIVNLAILSTLGIFFLTVVDKEWKLNPAENHIELFEIYGSILLFMAVIIIVALAVMFSTRMNLVLTLVCCTSAFLIGLISDYMFGRFAETALWAKVGKVIVPNFQVFWISDAIYEGAAVPARYLLIGVVYAVLYSAGILMLAIAFFQKRQVG